MEMFPLKSLSEGFLDWEAVGDNEQDDATLSDSDGSGDDGGEGEGTTYPTEVEYNIRKNPTRSFNVADWDSQ